MAASDLAIASSAPSAAAVRTNISGSITDEASQNAITAGSGRPSLA